MNTDLEQRLRSALAAQATRVTPDRLRPALPPTALPARSPAPMLLRRAAWAAATLLLVAVAVITLRPTGPAPQHPTVVPPSPSSSSNPPSPVPSPAPSTSTPPSPSPSRSLSLSHSPIPASRSGDDVAPSQGHVIASPGTRSSAP
ncbi:hypothetical protein AB0J72_56280 [Dactylosporangium sp. NPDC049742]|uniref:hypothetical protein n=1 Tax=Dactylosporangium sp. NPDC049742 TaxID=3154737 RepID=UPI0034404F1F